MIWLDIMSNFIVPLSNSKIEYLDTFLVVIF